jgi:Family of unknown function (DUF5689)
MKNHILKVIISCLFIISLTSCVKENYNDPNTECIDTVLVSNKNVEDIYNTNNVTVPVNPYGFSTSDPLLGENDIIEAYVTSSDEGGNFFKTVSFVSTDGTRGFSMSIDEYNLYNDNPISLKPGRKVYIKLKGLYVARPTGGAIGMVFGGAPAGSFNTLSRIPVSSYKKFIIPTCKVVDEEQIVIKQKTVAGVAQDLTITDVLNETYLNKLVELSNVQFTDDFADGTYDPNRLDTSDSNTFIQNTLNPSQQLVIRTSSFANFAGNKIPVGSGKIRGVLTKFNSTYQIILRTERDVKLTEPRIIFPSFPLGGTTLNFSGTVTEDFTSFNVATNTFPKYINDKTAGNKYWDVKEFSSNKYLEMSAFQAGPSNICFFMIPVDFSAANSLKFKKKVRFNAGITLKVSFVKSENFVNGFLNKFAFTNITSKFNLTYPAIGASEADFTTSGVYQIPAELTGNGYFIFEYAGTTFPALTTTIQLDDIVIQ